MAAEPAPVAAHKWARHPQEWYVEPQWCSERLFDVEPIESGAVLDPCCGEGRILDAALARGYATTGRDIVDRMGFSLHAFDLADARGGFATANGAALVTNPPFKAAASLLPLWLVALAGGHIEKLCVLLPGKFMFGAARAAGLFENTPPVRAYALVPRPSMPPGDHPGPASGGKEDFLWLVWTPENLLLKSPPAWSWLARDDAALRAIERAAILRKPKREKADGPD